MSLTQTFAGIGILSAVGVTVLGAVLPAKPAFMVVHDITYADGMITTERTIIKPDTVADWRVTIVSDTEKPPTCNTIPGPDLHEGWSTYEASERRVQAMPLDVWVGQEGCLSRHDKHPGEYTQYITWTPRDGREPVTFVGPIVID